MYGVPLVAIAADWLPGVEMLVVAETELTVLVTVVLEALMELDG